jgi:hypothetical protein
MDLDPFLKTVTAGLALTAIFWIFARQWWPSQKPWDHRRAGSHDSGWPIIGAWPDGSGSDSSTSSAHCGSGGGDTGGSSCGDGGGGGGGGD